MKPTTTSHIIRAILTAVGSKLRVDSKGLYEGSPDMPDTSLSSDAFRDAWLAYNIARKREVDNTGTEEAAITAFFETEARCGQLEEEGFLAGLDWPARNSLLRARNIAHRILGDKPPSDWYRECSFTGGASTSRRRSESHPAFKWWGEPCLDVTTSALRHLLKLKESCEVIDAVWTAPGALSMTEDPRKCSPFFRLVRGSRLQTVKKNYKTDRVILIEPDGNMVLQKGVGNIIRKRLKRVGINLNSQTRNQRLAFAGSISGTLGTLDIESASDSVLLGLLRFLLPWDWYVLILELRSPKFFHDGVWYDLVKTSSMGNGFTFELESLVFYCLTQAVVDVLRPKETRVGIYGDDIIVAASVCGYLEVFLNRCGFKLNKQKSFWRGPFRESCGKHYHNGLDVTPVYCKADLVSPDEIFRLYNQIRGWARQGLETDWDERLNSVLAQILNLLKKEERVQVPIEFGPTAGLHYADVSYRKVRSYTDKRGWHMLAFYAFDTVKTDLTNRVDDECIWLYRHMERWTASCPLGISEYTSFALVREGELKRRQVIIPAARVNLPMP